VADLIPYEQQDKSPGDRLCGAAALCMVYRSLGLICTQSEIWQRISRGQRSARTYQLAADALTQGFAALVIQARDPWSLLQRCARPGVRAVINQRLRRGDRRGHFTVLVAIDGDQVRLHDPQLGPERQVSRADMTELWQPGFGAEITGNILVAFARLGACGTEAATIVCDLCGSESIEPMTCPGCKAQLTLQPAAVLGCVKPECRQRTWSRIHCPHCDRAISNLPERAAATTW
jgi:hypothetical protein